MKAENTEDKPKGFQVTDRRFWVEDKAENQKVKQQSKKYPSFVEELKARTEAAEQKLREKIEQLESENIAFRTRIERQIETRVEVARTEIYSDILEIVDNLELAIEKTSRKSDIESLKTGVELILSLLLRKLQNADIQVINNLHQDFDPNESEAIGVIPVSDPELDQKIVSIVQRGYRLGDKVIRPAKVQVGSFSDEG
jgi:molecular chaperone GrpE (heat shock protein)